ncbi:MAG: hypothetical protein ACR2MX_16710 [Cyclobacteriaceae bacterium]
MEKLGKILGINLAIMLIHLVVMQSLGFVALATLLLQIVVNWILAGVLFAKTKPRLGKSYLLSGFVVGLIGLSFCFAALSGLKNMH